MDREFARSALGAPARRLLAIVLMALMAVTMTPALGTHSAFAETAEGGLLYEIENGEATLVGFEDGASLAGALIIPETVPDGDGAATVKAVEIAEGQVAEGVTSLTLPQTVEAVKTEGLAAAFPALASVEVAAAAEGDGAAGKGAYSSVAGMLFRSAAGQASSDGSAFAEDALELVWAPPAMVVARIPLECKAIASGAFMDAAALETVMSFGKMESIASAEKDAEGNVTKPGAFTDEQISRLTIVVPGTNYAVTGEGAERVSGSVALSEKTDMLEKRKAWFHHGFDTEQIIMGAPFGEIEGVNAVSDEGVMEDRSLVTPLENGRSHLELTPEEEAEKAARRGEDPEAGLSFSYQASMDLSVRWAGDRSATPAHVDVPAYAKVDGVTYQVAQIEPNAFEGAVFLSSVTIPEGVTAIGESAFAGCTNLKSVSLPSTLKTIDYAAFKGTALESITIPESVIIIGGEAFADCASLTSVELRGTPAVAESAGIEGTTSLSAEGELAEDGNPSSNDAVDSLSPYIASPSLNKVGSFMNFDVVGRRNASGQYWTINEHTESAASLPELSFPVTSSKGLAYSSWYVADTYVTPTAKTLYAFVWSDVNGGNINDHSSGSWEAMRLCARRDGNFTWGLRFYNAAATGAPVGTWPYVSGTDSLFLGGDVLIKFDSAGGSSVSPQTYITHNGGETYRSLPTPTRAGYKFVGWTLAGAPVSASSVIPNTGIYTLTAQWDDINADVSVEGIPDEGVALQAGSFGSNAMLADGKLTINPSGWSGAHSVWAKVESNGDLKIYEDDSTSSSVGCTLKSPTNPGYYFDKWVIDGVDVTSSSGLVEISNAKPHTFKLVYPPKQFDVTYNPNGGTWGDVDGAGMDDKKANKVVEGRTYPEGADLLTDLTREGFWFVGWSLSGNTETVDSDRLKEQYDDFTLTAVWQPRVYRVEYDVNAANNNTAEGSADITAPGNSYFVHPAAIPAVYDEAADGTRTLKANLNSLGIRQGQLNGDASWYAYGLPHPNNEGNALGYVFAGWSTDNREIGVKPDHGPWTHFQDDADMLATLFPTQTNEVPRSDGGESYQWGNNYARVFSTWLSYQAVPVTLGTEGPVGPATAADGTGDGETVSAKALDGSALGADLAEQEIYYWPEKGLVKGTYNNKQNTDEIVAASGDDLTLKGGMSLSMMGRYGYRFIGWGVRGSGYADDPDRSKCTIYAYYDEKGRTIKLTDAGAAKVAEWNAKPWEGSYDPASKEWEVKTTYQPTEWEALWEVRTYDVTLRLPASAVNGVKLNNGGYTWVEDRTSAGEVGDSPSWYVGKKTWKYWDTLAVPEPAYRLNTGFNTYEGWYNDKEKMYAPGEAGSTDATIEGRKVATEAAVYKGNEFHIMRKTATDGDGNAVTKPAGTWGNLFVEETRDSAARDQFGNAPAGGDRVADGEVVLWLRYTPVYINATAPMGVWLANDEATGGAYVVGSDKRMHLEAKASFTVKTDTTHDLVLTDVKATDIVSATATQGGTGAQDTVTDVVLDEGANAGSNGKGFCEQLLDVYSSSDDASKVYYDTDSSRMFWISPESTVTYNAALGEANATSDANAKRRYFGFGHVDGDNALHGDASVKGPKNVLDAFRLKHGASMSAGGMGGLVVGSEIKGEGADAGKTVFKNYDFYYGLDLRRCKIDPGAAQALLEASNAAADGAADGAGASAWEYNEPHKQPLVRVTFTFAVERNELVSYSARMGETFDAGAVAARANAAAGDADVPEISVGPALS